MQQQCREHQQAESKSEVCLVLARRSVSDLVSLASTRRQLAKGDGGQLAACFMRWDRHSGLGHPLLSQ